jgi:hypothetical protein
MLVVMSFNGNLFIACVLGLSLGFFIFGYMKKKHEMVEAALEIKKLK